MSIASQCPGCCTPLAANMGARTRRGFASKVGFFHTLAGGLVPFSQKRYKSLSLGGYSRRKRYSDFCVTISFETLTEYDSVVNLDVLGTFASATGENTTTPECCPPGAPTSFSQTYLGPIVARYAASSTSPGAEFVAASETYAEQNMATTACFQLAGDSTRIDRYQTATLSNEVTDEEVFALAEQLHGYVGDLPSSFFAPVNLARDGGLFPGPTLASRLTGSPFYELQDLRYYPGFNFRAGTTQVRGTWLVRTVPQAGVALSSIEVTSPGRYRPAVTLSAPPTGGTQAYAIAEMTTSGTVGAIRLLNPGSGYTTSPTVTVATATAGGTSAIGWVATIAGGQVTGIAGGTSGDYLPLVTLSSPLTGGTQATAAATLRPDGGLASVALTNSGAAYQSASAAITNRTTGATAATLLVHLGTEVENCLRWDGKTPAGRWYRRAVDPAGESIDALEIVSAPNALPVLSIVNLSNPRRGAGLVLKITGMSPAGAITGITVVDGGKDYDSGTIQVTAAPRDIFNSAGFTGFATFSVVVAGDRTVSAVNVVSGGDYLPRIVITPRAPAVSGTPLALGTCTMGADGSLSSFSVTSPSSGFGRSVNLGVRFAGQPDQIRGVLNGVVHVHYGTETEFTDLTRPADPDVWPVGFEPDTSPFLLLGAPDGSDPYYKYFEIEAPAEGDDGIISVESYRVSEDTIVCP